MLPVLDLFSHCDKILPCWAFKLKTGQPACTRVVHWLKRQRNTIEKEGQPDPKTLHSSFLYYNKMHYTWAVIMVRIIYTPECQCSTIHSLKWIRGLLLYCATVDLNVCLQVDCGVVYFNVCMRRQWEESAVEFSVGCEIMWPEYKKKHGTTIIQTVYFVFVLHILSFATH